MNTNPQIVGNGTIAAKKSALGQRYIAPQGPVANNQSVALKPAQKTNTAPTTQTSATADPITKPTGFSVTAGAGKFDLPNLTYNNPAEDPRDATYWANIAKLKFSSEQSYGRGLLEQSRSDEDYGVSTQQAIRNRAIQQRSLGEDSMRGNLGASGWLNRNEAEQTTDYTEGRAQAGREKERGDQDRTAAQRALEQSFGLDAQAYFAEAGGRYAEAARLRAQNEAPQVGIESSAAATAPATTTKPKLGIAPAVALPPAKKRAIANRRKA